MLGLRELYLLVLFHGFKAVYYDIKYLIVCISLCINFWVELFDCGAGREMPDRYSQGDFRTHHGILNPFSFKL